MYIIIHIRIVFWTKQETIALKKIARLAVTKTGE